MNDWTGGYVADINYTYGYYHELNPYRADYAFLMSGYAAPKVKTACELGFGQGVSIGMHSAASDIEWYGTDFLPSQVEFAKHLSSGQSPSPQLFDDSFQEFLERDDLPGFDFIALHGIWSWISDENRQAIVDFIDKYLNVGGILYVSYNIMPGWTPTLPIRELMSEYANNMCPKGMPSDDKVDSSLDFMNKLFQTKPSLTENNPSIKTKFETISKQNKSYLAHEYFNSNWKPMSFLEMSKWLKQAKLEFVSPANYEDIANFLTFSEDQVKFLDSIQDKNFKEFIKDHMTAKQFRRDYWVRGTRKLSETEKISSINSLKFVLSSDLSKFEMNISSSRGNMELSKDFYQKILDHIADFKIRTIGEFKQEMLKLGFNETRTSQAILVLLAKGTIYIVANPSPKNSITKNVATINSKILHDPALANINMMASPVTGSGIPISSLQIFMLKRFIEGVKTKADMKSQITHFLKETGQLLRHKGEDIKDTQKAEEMIDSMINNFFDHYIDLIKKLKIF